MQPPSLESLKIAQYMMS